MTRASTPGTPRRRWVMGIAMIAALLAILFIGPDWRRARSDDLPAAAPGIESPASVTRDDPHAAHAGAQAAATRVAIDVPARQSELLGLQVETVEALTLDDPLRALASVVADESRVIHVHARVSGWIEALYVNTTGEPVRAGQALAGVYSPEIESSQEEFLAALRRAEGGPRSAVPAAARQRLKVLGMREADIIRLERSGRPQRLLSITAPRSGVVLNRAVSEGTTVDPSTEVVTLVDLSVVWVIAEVAVADASLVPVGTQATLDFGPSLREPLDARVQYVYPTLTEDTRTLRVRMSVPNPDGALRPGMYGSALFPVAARRSLTVPRDALVDTGPTQHVFVRSAQGVFEPRRVEVGARRSDRVEILHGLEAGEHVVVSGVFLLDSESRLRASGGTGHVGHGGSPKPAGDEAVDRTGDAAVHDGHLP